VIDREPASRRGRAPRPKRARAFDILRAVDMGPPKVSETAGCLGRLEEILRLTAPPAGQDEICDQGLRAIASVLGARAGVVLTPPAHGAPAALSASWGRIPADGLVRVGLAALDDSGGADPGAAGTGSEAPLVLPVPLEGRARGVMVFDVPDPCPPDALQFAHSAAQVVSAALRAARAIGAGREQGELLARRNAELEILGEIAAHLQACVTEEGILEAVLDLVLAKLGLGAGWIFWGEESAGRLELAAARGVTEAFVREAREHGIGRCLCLDVFDTGRPRTARNTLECPRLPELVGERGPLTHACIPLKFDRGVLGVLNIANRPGQVFSPQELKFLETVGTQVCLAVDKIRTGRAETRRNAEARALASLAHAIGGSLEQERVLAAVGEDIRQLLGFDRCAIFLCAEDGALSLAYLSGPPMEGVEIGRPVDLEASGSRALPDAVRERRTIVIDDARDDPSSNPEVARRWGIGSAIIVPLAAHGHLSGVLHATRERVAPFTPDEVALAGALAGQAAVAIENARLYREARDAYLGLREAQEGMMRAERMAAVGTLASSLAHEIRNPLNSITLMLVLLSRRLARLEGGTGTELTPMVESVRHEVERLDALVEEFLSHSTIDRLERQAADPAAVVRDMLLLMGPVAASHGIAVREDLPATLPRLSLDRQKMKQVLINLARNAIEAMPSGGTLAVSASVEGEGVVIAVADTGVGIEPGIDVFDFFTTTKRGGTGLGLPISRRIVEAHGGRLMLESTPGRGTTFRVLLPARDSARRIVPGERP
jgi:signal transduction histidine kinase